jgi:hypothetical protein
MRKTSFLRAVDFSNDAASLDFTLPAALNGYHGTTGKIEKVLFRISAGLASGKFAVVPKY